MAVDLVLLYETDKLFKVIAMPIMLDSSRLNYKRDRLRAALSKNNIKIVFEMGDLRKLQYYLHPNDK